MKPVDRRAEAAARARFLVLRHEASLKLAHRLPLHAMIRCFLVLRHEASLKQGPRETPKAPCPGFLVLRHEASLKLTVEDVATQVALVFPRASARGLIEAKSRAAPPGTPYTVSSCFGTRPH